MVVRPELMAAANRRWLASVSLAIDHVSQAGPLADAFIQQYLVP
jgi:hypothetical protein